MPPTTQTAAIVGHFSFAFHRPWVCIYFCSFTPHISLGAFVFDTGCAINIREVANKLFIGKSSLEDVKEKEGYTLYCIDKL